jgi:NAD(P)-dependent dehydrogenase (short-subunit alcohol dehydrogenase family)
MHACRLGGKVAVITGAASTIGRAIATKFVANGARVLLADKQLRTCQDLADKLNKDYVGTNSAAAGTQQAEVAHAMFCDVTKESDISDAIEQAKETYGIQYLDIFYNNAWINKDVTPIVNSAVYKETMEVNLGSVLASIKCAGAEIAKNPERGCILCTGTTTGLLGDAIVPSAYSFSKTAVVALVRAAAADLARQGVRVNAISPHRVAPSLDEDALSKIFPKASAAELGEVMKKYVVTAKPEVTAEHVADAAVFLASDASKGITGHNLVIHGEFPLTT